MVKFIIVRHGFSLGNKEGRFTGQLDVPLDEIGYAQAESVAKYILDNFKIDVIYSSELCRAYDTALPVAKALGLEVKKRKGLNEVDVGLWQGKRIDDVEKEFPESFELYRRSPGLSRFDGGESYAELRERVVIEFDNLAKENEGNVEDFLGSHPEFTLQRMRTLTPDEDRTDGFFFAVLERVNA